MKENEKCSPGDAGSIIANAEFKHYITVTRNSTAINSPLPFILYGTDDVDGNFRSTFQLYKGVLGAPLPAGYTMTSAFDPAGTGDLILTFTNGVLQDTITIHSIGIRSYYYILQELKQKKWKSRMMLYSCTNTAQFNKAGQLGNDIVIGSVAGGENTDVDYIRPFSCRLPENVNSDVVCLFMNHQAIDNKVAMMGQINAVAMTMEFDVFLNGLNEMKYARKK